MFQKLDFGVTDFDCLVFKKDFLLKALTQKEKKS